MNTALRVYHRSPRFVQNGLLSLYGLYLQNLRYGRGSRRYDAELREHEGWDADRIDALVFDLLRARAVLALERVPAYRPLRDRLADVRRAATREEILAVFPVLSKETVRRDPEAFVPAGFGARLLRASTSGTTGTPLRLLRSVPGMRRQFAFFRRVRRWWGVSHWSRTATVMGRQVVPIDQSSPPFWRHSAFTRNLLLSSYHMSAATLPAYAAAVRRHAPRQIVCYPSSGFLLARAVLAGGPLRGVRVVFTTAETLSAEQRETMQAAFGCPVADEYGSGEWAVSASQCRRLRYHLHPEYGLLEVLDDAGRPVSRGSGRGVATGFVNDAMVLMRYDTGDRFELRPEGCGCGLPFPTLASVEGRCDDFVETADGRLIGRLDHVFKELPGILECQLVQERIGEIEARVVAGEGWSRAGEDELTRELHERLGYGMMVRVRRVGSIPRTANGKFRAVIGIDRGAGGLRSKTRPEP